jgi:hypothetical protein
MCGRFTSLLSPELLTAIYGVPVPPYLFLEPRYNIAPSQPCWSFDRTSPAIANLHLSTGVVLCRRAPAGINIHTLSQNRLKQDKGVKY